MKTIEIIAEIANAHQGDPEQAIALAREATAAGADAVKFQIYFADEMLTKKHPRYEHFKKQSFNAETWHSIIKKVRGLGKNIYADVFGLDALRVAMDNDLDGFKVHSSDLCNTPLLKKLAYQDKKVILAIGGSSILEIAYAINQVGRINKPAEIVLMHGFQAYPTSVSDASLNRLLVFRQLFSTKVSLGYADHCDAEDPFAIHMPLMALPLGIFYIEKHITLDRSTRGIDYYSSLEPIEFRNFVDTVHKALNALGENPLVFSEAERNYRETVKKSWVTTRPMHAAEKIEAEDVVMKRAFPIINTMEYERLVGSIVENEIQNAEECITNYHIQHNILAIIVARYNSSRLPGKAMLEINGIPALSHLFERLKLCKQRKYVDTVAFCTTIDSSDDCLVSLASQYPFKIYRGSVDNVLSRMMLAINDNKDHDIILRITGDDILIDPEYLHETVIHHLKTNANYTDAKELPSGTEVEVFNATVLHMLHTLSYDTNGTEYLTNYIKNNQDQFVISHLPVDNKKIRNYRLTLDTQRDYEVLCRLLTHMKEINKEFTYTMDDICCYLKNNPDILKINSTGEKQKKDILINTDINWSGLTKPPLVTVYVTNFNYGKYIERAIDSVLTQKFRDFEVIVIDDGSSDDSRQVIEKYRNNPKVTIVHQKNKGLNVTNNIALKLSRGKYIMRLDADDYLDDNALLIMVEKMEHEPNLALVFPDYYLMDDKGNIYGQERRNDIRSVNLLDKPAHGACTLFRKNILVDIGGYNNEFRCQDGYDLWLKVIDKYKIANINIPLFYYRQHEKSMTKNETAIFETRHEIIKQHLMQADVKSKGHLVILPIRGGEDAPLALKNFAGTNLMDITFESILKNENTTKVIISSPDQRIVDYAKRKFGQKEVIVDLRPLEYGGLNITLTHTVEYCLTQYSKELEKMDSITIVNYEYPLRKHFYIDKAINTLYLFDLDSVISVRQNDKNLYRHNGNGLISFENNRDLRLERDFLYEELGGIHTISLKAFLKHKSITSGKIGHIVMDAESCKKIESDMDFEIAELLYEKLKKEHS